MANKNIFHDVDDTQELIYLAVGAGSVCWENLHGAGVFDDAKARSVAADAYERLVEILSEAAGPAYNDHEPLV